MSEPIYVTRPSLAPLEEYLPYLETIWRTGVMTHNGPMVQRLEQELRACLGVEHVVCVASGTCALQIGLRALDLSGEIITTPFSFAATASIIAWEHCVPVFADIDPGTWNLDPEQVEAKITPRTTAILPVHVFSAPCDTARLDAIARRHGLKILYDAAHAMAVQTGGATVLRHGDISCVSFHATKLFNTAEGGACVTRDATLAERLRRMRFFGFDEAKDVTDLGMNAKMTEVAAGLGLANLPHMDAVRARRREKTERYRSQLDSLPFITFQCFDPESYNYSYMPVLFESEKLLLHAVERFAADNIYPRRYFHPSLNTLPVYRCVEPMPISEQVSRTVLCLPLYDTLDDADMDRICGHLAAL